MPPRGSLWTASLEFREAFLSLRPKWGREQFPGKRCRKVCDLSRPDAVKQVELADVSGWTGGALNCPDSLVVELNCSRPHLGATKRGLLRRFEVVLQPACQRATLVEPEQVF